MTDTIEAYYREHKAVFDDMLLIVLEGFNMEAIHKMRTSTKRLRTLFLFMEALTDRKFKAKKQLKKIRSLFKLAGKIREIQIEEQLVLSNQSVLSTVYRDYLEYLKQREHREISRFLKRLPSIDKREQIIDEQTICEVISTLKGDEIVKKAEKFLQFKQQTIADLKTRPHSNQRIHASRTHIKQIYYLYDILIQLAANESLLRTSAERLREIEQYMGTWHDLVNSSVYMNAFMKTRKYSGDPKYKFLRKKISEDRKKMRKEITEILFKELDVN